MIGGVTIRNMQSSLQTYNKLYIVASCWTIIDTKSQVNKTKMIWPYGRTTGWHPEVASCTGYTYIGTTTQFWLRNSSNTRQRKAEVNSNSRNITDVKYLLQSSQCPIQVRCNGFFNNYDTQTDRERDVRLISFPMKKQTAPDVTLIPYRSEIVKDHYIILHCTFYADFSREKKNRL